MSKMARSFKTKRLRTLFLIVLLFFFAGANLLLYAKTIVLEGTPKNVKQSTAQKLREGALTPEEQLQAKIVISKEGSKYFWDSNGQGEMIRQEKKNAYYFVDLTGKGFVEVVLDEKTGKYLYMENKSSDGSTYYGEADLFLKD
ncbi:MAG: hypothetical protein HY767_01190 [Candidatus Omnitrophica bacterium]|nr:hypothetical protein [Candidatus Omnitrophota bacterium]